MKNHKFHLGKYFQEIFYRTNSLINERSGWIVKLIEYQYINISPFRPLIGSSYIKLPVELRNKKGLISIENNDQKYFLWCHFRDVNPLKIIQKGLQSKIKN